MKTFTLLALLACAAETRAEGWFRGNFNANLSGSIGFSFYSDHPGVAKILCLGPGYYTLAVPSGYGGGWYSSAWHGPQPYYSAGIGYPFSPGSPESPKIEHYPAPAPYSYGSYGAPEYFRHAGYSPYANPYGWGK